MVPEKSADEVFVSLNRSGTLLKALPFGKLLGLVNWVQQENFANQSSWRNQELVERGKIRDKVSGQAVEQASVYDSLRKKGHRITAQRETILAIFREQEHGTHLSAEELYAILLKRASNVSLATTYRTLKLLSQLGLLRELDFAEGHKHYELKQDDLPHQHIICLSCNKTLEFEDHFLEEAGQKIGQRYNFHVIDAQFKIFGLCPACRSATRKKRGGMSR